MTPIEILDEIEDLDNDDLDYLLKQVADMLPARGFEITCSPWYSKPKA